MAGMEPDQKSASLRIRAQIELIQQVYHERRYKESHALYLRSLERFCNMAIATQEIQQNYIDCSSVRIDTVQRIATARTESEKLKSNT